jgi:hypothetical protein
LNKIEKLTDGLINRVGEDRPREQNIGEDRKENTKQDNGSNNDGFNHL